MEELDVKVLRMFDDKDWHDCLFWRVGDDGSVRWLINCNDIFTWACSDCEQITRENFDMIQPCIDDMAKADPDWRYTWEALYLWVARVRKERPQGAAYPDNKAFWPLFDACGPERPIGLDNPYKPEHCCPEHRHENTKSKK